MYRFLAWNLTRSPFFPLTEANTLMTVIFKSSLGFPLPLSPAGR